MDARLDPARYAERSEGDAHVIRTAGGRATADAIRSLVISYKLLGTKEWFVIRSTREVLSEISGGFATITGSREHPDPGDAPPLHCIIGPAR